MDWLTRVFTGKDWTETEQKAEKRRSKEHSRKVRAHEKELRHGKDNGAVKRASFFWGSPGQTYESNVRGPEGIRMTTDESAKKWGESGKEASTSWLLNWSMQISLSVCWAWLDTVQMCLMDSLTWTYLVSMIEKRRREWEINSGNWDSVLALLYLRPLCEVP